MSFRSALTAAEAERSVEVPVSQPQPGEYLLEPAPAIVRSHLVAEFAQSVGAHLLDEHLAYLCSAEPVEHPLVACYEVLEEIPLQEKQLKRWVREQGFTALTIKKRGVDIVPEQLRARLLGSAGSKPSKKKQKKNANSSGGAQESSYRPATLVFTRIGAGRDSPPSRLARASALASSNPDCPVPYSVTVRDDSLRYRFRILRSTGR